MYDISRDTMFVISRDTIRVMPRDTEYDKSRDALLDTSRDRLLSPCIHYYILHRVFDIIMGSRYLRTYSVAGS